MQRPMLVGEANPYGGDPEMALYPLPERASGGRLAALLGMSAGEYLRAFDRANLCPERWDGREARRRAAQLTSERGGGFVLLGAKVARAFGVEFRPFFWRVVATAAPLVPWTYAVLPHPSGLNRLWNDPASPARARDALRKAGLLG